MFVWRRSQIRCFGSAKRVGFGLSHVDAGKGAAVRFYRSLELFDSDSCVQLLRHFKVLEINALVYAAKDKSGRAFLAVGLGFDLVVLNREVTARDVLLVQLLDAGLLAKDA